MADEEFSSIAVSNRTHRILDAMRRQGRMRMSFNSLIEKLIDTYEQNEIRKDRIDELPTV